MHKARKLSSSFYLKYGEQDALIPFDVTNSFVTSPFLAFPKWGG